MPRVAFATFKSRAATSIVAWAFASLVLGLLPSRVLRAEEFFVQFRDGSTVLADVQNESLTWSEYQAGRSGAGAVLPMSNIGSITLARLPVTRRLAHVRSLLEQLSSEDFEQRERATAELRDKGLEFAEVVEAYQESSDLEIRWRVKGILHHFNSSNRNRPKLDFDALVLARQGSAPNAATAVDGDSGDFVLSVTAFGQPLEIPRDRIAAFWRPGYQPQNNGQDQTVGERIGSDAIDQFPANSIRIGFGNLPSGAEVPDGTVLDDAYTDWGVRFSTSIEKGSLVSFNFGVGGAPSRRPSAGGHSTLSKDQDYQGVTTIRFHAPGRQHVPATVSMFGCYMAIIKPEGTIVRFFDAQGQLITQLATTRNTWEFVGFRSPRPIARVEIHPTAADPNYAIDDVMFDPPRVLSETSDGELARVSLKDGQLLSAASLSLDGSDVLLSDLTIGIAKLKISLDQIAYLAPIAEPYNPLEAPPVAWIQTETGDRMIVDLLEDSARPAVNAEVTIPVSNIRALWSSHRIDVEIGLVSDVTSAHWIDNDQVAHAITEFALRDSSVVGKSDQSIWNEPISQTEIPLIVLDAPPVWDDQAPYVRLIDGQVWYLNSPSVRFLGWGNQAARIELFGRETEIPLNRIGAIKLDARPLGAGDPNPFSEEN